MLVRGVTGGDHTDQLAAGAEPAAGEAGGAEEVPERVEEQRVEERLGQLDVAEMARAVGGGLPAGLAAAHREFQCSETENLSTFLYPSSSSITIIEVVRVEEERRTYLWR